MKCALRRLVFCVGFGALVGSWAMAADNAESRPNIIWLMAEDMGLDLECYGMPGVKTPNLNRLAREGAMFTKAYCRVRFVRRIDRR